MSRGPAASPATRLVAALPLAALVGCGQMAIDGEVIDVTGAPLAGAKVTVVGTPCAGQTDAAGKFSIPCGPGTYTVSIGQRGYITDNIEALEATERQRYDVGKRLLIKIPEQEGLLMFNADSYEPMQRGLLERRAGGVGQNMYKHYCLPEDFENPVNAFNAGIANFFENESDGWRIFRAGADGCVYKMSPSSKTQWGVDYAEKPASEEHQVVEGKKIVRIELTPGRYFIADWDKGFFTKDEIDGTEGFGGYYVEAQ